MEASIEKSGELLVIGGLSGDTNYNRKLVCNIQITDVISIRITWLTDSPKKFNHLGKHWPVRTICTSELIVHDSVISITESTVVKDDRDKHDPELAQRISLKKCIKNQGRRLTTTHQRMYIWEVLFKIMDWGVMS